MARSERIRRAFSDALKHARKLRGYSQAELAGRAMISKNFVYYLERGARSPSLEMLLTLAKALRVTPQKFLALIIHYLNKQK